MCITIILSVCYFRNWIDFWSNTCSGVIVDDRIESLRYFRDGLEERSVRSKLSRSNRQFLQELILTCIEGSDQGLG